jgi:hypothetical protein
MDQEVSRELDNPELLDKACWATELTGAGRIPNCLAARGAGAGGVVGGANVIPLETRNRPHAKIAGGTSERGQTMAEG